MRYVERSKRSTPSPSIQGLSVECSTLAQVRPLIEDGHYLGKVHNRGRVAFALVSPEGELIGAALFGQPSRETIAVSLWKCENEEDRKFAVLASMELTRFYTLDGLHPDAGTWFLGRAVKELRGGCPPCSPNTEMLVAYSDPIAQHHGGLYQAASWLYTGQSGSDHYHYEDAQGARVSKQTPWQYAKKERLAGTAPAGERPADGERRVAKDRGWVKVKDLPKYRYVKPLTRRARRGLALSVLDYPKPRDAGHVAGV